jgi:hypothetical protein
MPLYSVYTRRTRADRRDEGDEKKLGTPPSPNFFGGNFLPRFSFFVGCLVVGVCTAKRAAFPCHAEFFDVCRRVWRTPDATADMAADGAEGMDVDDGSPPTPAQGAKPAGLIKLDRGTAIKVTPLYGVQGTSRARVTRSLPSPLHSRRRSSSGCYGPSRPNTTLTHTRNTSPTDEEKKP